MLGRSQTVLQSVLHLTQDAILSSRNTECCREDFLRDKGAGDRLLDRLPTWDGERRLSHIGGYNDEAVARGNSPEDGVLGTSGQHGIERQHMHGHKSCLLLPRLVLRSLITLRSAIPLSRHIYSVQSDSSQFCSVHLNTLSCKLRAS